MPIKKSEAVPTGVPGIKRDGPDRFLVVATWNDPKSGRRRKREGIAPTFEEAVVLRRRLRTEAGREQPTRMRLGDFAPLWLRKKKGELALTTVERYVTCLAHITARFGEYWIDALDETDIEGWLDDALRRGRAPATVNSWLRVLRGLLRGAVRKRLRWDNPARLVRARREGRTRGDRARALTAAQLGKLISTAARLGATGAIAPDLSRLIQVVAWTGVRRGEVLALEWTDVVDGELHVVRAASRGRVKTTKTDDPRLIGIAPALRAVLEEQREWLRLVEHPGRASGLMFPTEERHARLRARRTGAEPSWVRAESCTKAPLERIIEESTLPRITLHSLRRSYENLLRQAGVDEQVRRTVAGWRSTETQAIYAGVDPAERRKAALAVMNLVVRSEANRGVDHSWE